MSLPPEVLALLGDDATPEKAIEKLDASADRNVERAMSGRPPVAGWATKAHWMAIAAAAIRECEARRKCGEHSVVDALECDGCKEKSAAWSAYDALRNWRSRG